MASETVKVIVRVRPLNEREINLNCNTVIDIDGNRGQCSIRNPNDLKSQPKNFFFDGAYNERSVTEQLYADIVYPLVENVTEGYNGTIFAYGQTGCGKSFTMQGIIDPVSQRGVIPRAFDHIFESISLVEKTKYLVHASYLEIYNEEIRDLLGKDVKAKLDLKEHPEKGVYVAGLSMHKVSNVHDCQIVMERGWKNRSTGATLMNVDSSRSHSIFTIFLEMVDTNDIGEEHIRAGKLNLVDLAGSERQSKTGATGDRLKEATKINLSLSALGNVISALVDGKSKHIPYRDSKLTRLLQDSLGGNTKTLMIACLSPADNNYEESLSTLRYANRAKNIQNKPKINEDPKDALLRQYQEEIDKLRLMLAGKLPVDVGGQPSNTAVVATMSNAEKQKLIEIEREKIREEYEAKLFEKEMQYSAEAADKAKLQQEMEKLRSYYDKKMSEVDMKDIFSTSDAPKRSQSQTVNSTDGHTVPQSIDDFEKSLESPNIFGTVNADGSVVIVNPTSNTSAISTAAVKTGNRKLENGGEDKNFLLSKLKSLQESMVGGEQVDNKNVQERHTKRKRYAEDRRRKLLELNEKMEDEGIMVGVFENIQDDLRSKSKILQKVKEKNSNLQQEIFDLQDEYQKEKSDYLETIRKLEQENKLLQSILDKVQPCLKRGCNYTNLDKIKSLAKYNEESDSWILPQLKVEQVQLPDTNGGLGSRDSDDETYYRKLSRRPDQTPDYFNYKKSAANISQGYSTNMNHPVSPVSTNNSNYSKQIDPQYELSNSFSSDFRAAEVHGQMSMDNQNWRTVHRLEAISASKKNRKKKDKYAGSGMNNSNSMNDF